MSGFYLRSIVGVLLWLLSTLPAAATHLVGGELSYKFLDANGSRETPYRYQITARIYLNAATSNLGATSTILVSSRAAGMPVLTQQAVGYTSMTSITPPAVPGCPVQVPEVVLGIYTLVVELPLVSEGYQASYNATARNAGITNVQNPTQQSMLLSVDMTPPSIPNTSPVFSTTALNVICVGDTSALLNNAYDADGDRLSYAFVAPNSNGLGASVTYAPGYGVAQPFGSNGYVALDARTGLARYLSQRQGVFLLAIDVSEYRVVNGREILLSTVRRDIQIAARVCSVAPNQAPAFSAASLAQQDFTVREGQRLDFTITATDPDLQPLVMTVRSVLLDGAGPIDATVNGQAGAGVPGSINSAVDVTGIGTVTAAFHLTAGCGQARPAPYDVLVTVSDQVCGSKSIAGVFRIAVVGDAPLTRVRGDSVRCVQSTGTYTAFGPAFGQYRWTVRGGEIVGPATGRTVQVNWTASGPGTVAAQGIAPGGCPTVAATQAVTVVPGPLIKGPNVYCRADNTGLRYTVDGPVVAYQWSIDEGTIVSGQGTNSVVVDVVKGASTTLRVEAPNSALCPIGALRISPDSRCLSFYNVITPNGDRQNDRFVIENIEQYPNATLTIFNRWGRQIYQSTNYRNTYDGENNVPGVYYYFCQLPDGTRYKGWFELVR
ncbi:gliding motility-associated C-terminal domain-containing protein [Hymenobacter sp. 5317J-9]|uniref:T9SS type B sorting domain-containing protein n=1 Tax=Hymenobacter sp. 5317J-9 TaxID=2932250 RepID=UPI001FD6D5CF|nr:gliding motility-associated C-terminal domain-containing protein [Hymenobacter sp. 5317J-9]UOQ97383.1 gliding motility-associated C-terminal domain-containing protein [Hymenobacter sp. 5317J-9]